jgi:phosphate starvation-inducible PhoH-like protein
MGTQDSQRLTKRELAQERISLGGVDPLLVFGELDQNRKLLAEKYKSSITLRGDTIILQGEPKRTLSLKLKILSLIEEIKTGGSITKEDVQQDKRTALILASSGPVKPRSSEQAQYIKALGRSDLVVCTGPAGTGKTFLAVARASELLKRGVVRRIVLTRPAVEAGEKLGFLPGDFKEKVDPYLRPLYDALHELIPYEKIKRYIEDKRIEIAPLAYMRGRNLDNSFIILDEAQNTRKSQMKMFLTRLGIGSKACVTGDVTQIDLHDPMESGLVHIKSLFADVKGIEFVELTEESIVRHPLVREIVKAYESENRH